MAGVVDELREHLTSIRDDARGAQGSLGSREQRITVLLQRVEAVGGTDRARREQWAKSALGALRNAQASLAQAERAATNALAGFPAGGASSRTALHGASQVVDGPAGALGAAAHQLLLGPAGNVVASIRGQLHAPAYFATGAASATRDIALRSVVDTTLSGDSAKAFLLNSLPKALVGSADLGVIGTGVDLAVDALAPGSRYDPKTPPAPGRDHPPRLVADLRRALFTRARDSQGVRRFAWGTASKAVSQWTDPHILPARLTGTAGTTAGNVVATAVGTSILLGGGSVTGVALGAFVVRLLATHGAWVLVEDAKRTAWRSAGRTR